MMFQISILFLSLDFSVQHRLRILTASKRESSRLSVWRLVRGFGKNPNDFGLTRENGFEEMTLISAQEWPWIRI